MIAHLSAGKGFLAIMTYTAGLAAAAQEIASPSTVTLLVALATLGMSIVLNAVLMARWSGKIEERIVSRGEARDERIATLARRVETIETLTGAKVDAKTVDLIVAPLVARIDERFNAWDDRMDRTEEEIAVLRKWRHDHENDALGRRLLADADTREGLLPRRSAARRDASTDPRGEG